MDEDVLNETKTVAQTVREYLLQRPFIMFALQEGIVNYSSLARKIKKEIGARSIESIKAALIREATRHIKSGNKQLNGVLNILKKSKLMIQDRVGMISSQKNLGIHTPLIFLDVHSREKIYVVDQNLVDVDAYINNSILTKKNMITVTIKLPPEHVDTPGVLSYITQALSSKNINISHLVHSTENIVFLVPKEDGPKMFQVMEHDIFQD